MRSKTIFILLILISISFSSFAQQEEVEVTYIGNAGFLIEIGNKKILIDALFKGFEGSYELPQEVQTKLTSAQAPFNDVDLILVTHAHGDHINPDMVKEYMRNNPKAIFASTQQMVTAMDGPADRYIGFNPTTEKSDKKVIKEIGIETFYLPHGPDSKIVNIGYLISVNGITVFQTGDADFDQFTFEEFRSLKLPERKIDLAFIQHYYLTGDSLSTKFVNEGIGGNYIFPIHYHFTTPAFDSVIIRQNYPDAIIFEEELQSWHMPEKFPISTGYQFGQKQPGDSAVIFAPGIISLTDRLESNIIFSPDGRECYFGIIEIKENKVSYKIFYTEYINNIWTEQLEASFSVNNNVGDPFLSADGNKLFYSKDGDIWMVLCDENGWGEPKSLPEPINSDSGEGFYSETRDGDVYLSSKRPGGLGNTDIWRVRKLPDQSIYAENLGAVFNTSLLDYSPFVAPDGSYIIFGSYRARRDGLLYISFNNGNDQWTSPLNMNSCGAKVNNNTAHHSNPSLSPDGKFLFFRRHEADTIMDVYWVSSGIIEKLREKAMQLTTPTKFTDLEGDYLGQHLPGDTPVVFAPGLISVDSTIEHGSPTFSADGDEVFWQSNYRQNGQETLIFGPTMKRINGRWTKPEVSPYYSCLSISPDGKRLYFLPSEEESIVGKGPYYAEKKDGFWAEPVCMNLLTRFPEIKYAYNYSVTDNGTFYFLGYADSLGSMNDFGIYRMELNNGDYSKPELLPSSINVGEGILSWTPYISPDESYLLFSSNRLKPESDFGDIYVCFRKSDGTWTEAINLGTTINSDRQERFPSISPDGKYLFFTRWVANGNEDVMWVNTDVIDRLKKEIMSKK